ncbi:MAG TPA: phage portal protein [Candidatus Dormibacteraeota bacterium]|nr:phage portal protein [Candidatus Dormibacteraeota bacterium]
MTSIAPWTLKEPLTGNQAERIISAVARRSLSPGAAAWAAGNDEPVASPLRNAYQQVVWVYRAINALADQVANIPFLFSRGERGRENLITKGPLLDFYESPHRHLNRFQYWELRIIWLMLRGECFRIPIYEEPLSPTLSPRRLLSVVFVDPANMQHIVEDHELVGWRYTGPGKMGPLEPQVFLPEEVWFEKLSNPFDFWRGLPPLYIADTATRTDFAASLFMKGLIENNADLGVIVRTDQQLSAEQRSQLMTALRARKRHAGTADRPLLLWGGAQVVKPEVSSSDIQFLENRKFSRAEICAAFGVPEEIVTSTDHNKYDVMQGARLNFIENRVIPLCARLEAAENATAIPALVKSLGEGSLGRSSIENQKSKIENVIGWFDTDSLPIMQEALKSRITTAKIGFDMGIPVNELNRIFDLGFRPVPWGDTGYLPKNLVPAGTLTQNTKPK